MQDYEKYIREIKTELIKQNPYLIILFGSSATGLNDSKSDIDLLVVTKDEYMPKSFREKTELYLKISRAIAHINTKVAIDLLVYTIPMYEKMIKLNSSFSRELHKTGKILYESDYARMA